MIPKIDRLALSACEIEKIKVSSICVLLVGLFLTSSLFLSACSPSSGPEVETAPENISVTAEVFKFENEEQVLTLNEAFANSTPEVIGSFRLSDSDSLVIAETLAVDPDNFQKFLGVMSENSLAACTQMSGRYFVAIDTNILQELSQGAITDGTFDDLLGILASCGAECPDDDCVCVPGMNGTRCPVPDGIPMVNIEIGATVTPEN